MTEKLSQFKVVIVATKIFAVCVSHVAGSEINITDKQKVVFVINMKPKTLPSQFTSIVCNTHYAILIQNIF